MIPVQIRNFSCKSIPDLVRQRRFGYTLATSAPEEGGTNFLTGEAPLAGTVSEILIPIGTTGIGAGEGGGPEVPTFPLPLASRF
jgi:hypothetical protein